MIKKIVTFFITNFTFIFLIEGLFFWATNRGFHYLASVLFVILLLSPVLFILLTWGIVVKHIREVSKQVILLALVLDYIYILERINSWTNLIVNNINVFSGLF